MRFYGCDAHVAVISDIAQVLRNLGHTVDDDETMSGHHWTQPGKKKPCTLEYYGWCLREENTQKFYEKYKERFDPYDGFIVSYPISWCKHWIPWGKPIICVISVRYELPYTFGKEDWDKFNDVLRNHKQNKLFIHANSKADRDYLEYYTGLKVRHIPSLCEYVGIQHDPKQANETIARFARNGGIDDVPGTRGLRWGYEWPELYDCRACVHIPFHNNSMTFFENYNAGLPIFVPTKRLMKEWQHPNHPVGTFSEITWYRVSKKEEPKDKSPNNAQDPDVFNWWLDRSDYWDDEMNPFLIQFDSREDYIQKVASTNYAQVSENMKRFNVTRRARAYAQWQEVLNEIQQCLRS